jgi:hypothetical protein
LRSECAGERRGSIRDCDFALYCERNLVERFVRGPMAQIDDTP